MKLFIDGEYHDVGFWSFLKCWAIVYIFTIASIFALMCACGMVFLQ